MADSHRDVIQGTGVTTDELETLAAGAQARDQIMLNHCFAAVYDMADSYCRVRLGRTLAPSRPDIVQEICMATFLSLDRPREGGYAFRKLVYGIAAHKVADAYRHAARDRSITVAELPDRPHSDRGPEHRAVVADEVERLLAILPPTQRQVLVLTYFGDLAGSSAASILGVKPGQVRLLRHRALVALRKCAA